MGVISEQAKKLAHRTSVSEDELLCSNFTDEELHYIVAHASRPMEVVPTWIPEPTVHKTYQDYLEEKGIKMPSRYQLARA